MNVDIGHNSETAVAAVFPEPGKRGLADRDLASLERPRVDVVIEDEFENPATTISACFAQKIRAALPCLPERTAREFRCSGEPDFPTAAQPRRPPDNPAK